MSSSDHHQRVIDKVAVVVEKNPAIRGIMAALSPLPGVSILDATLTATATRMREERERVFFEELGKHGTITEEHLENQDFVHACISTITAARRTRHEEKIRLFARLLANAAKGDMAETADAYEEFQSILEDISFQEYQVLLLLNSMRFYKPTEFIPIVSVQGETVPSEEVQQIEYAQTISEQNQEIMNMWKPFLWTAQGKLGISSEEMPGLLERLKRTGLYQALVCEGSSGNLGFLTPNFHSFLKALQIEGTEA